MKKLQLVPEARQWYRLASVHVISFWTSVIAFIVADPSWLVHAWNQIPDELKSEVPHWARVVIVAATFLASLLAARLIRQPNSVQRPDDGCQK